MWRRLARRHPVGLIHGGGAWLGLSRASRAEVVRAFAPQSNHATVSAASRVRVLIATDVLSEGWNLQDARDVVSFDLPWNPVRLMQRLGRIDRLGSPHRTVRCHNFMPDHELDDLLGLVDRLSAKLDAIQAAVGDPGRILHPGSILRPGAESPTPSGAASHSHEKETRLPRISCRAADRLRVRLLRHLVREPGGAGPALCQRADRVLEFLAEPQRIGVEFELEALENQLRAARAGAGAVPRGGRDAAGLLDRLEAIQHPGCGSGLSPPAGPGSRGVCRRIHGWTGPGRRATLIARLSSHARSRLEPNP
jgi:hypothetical protein